MGPLNGHIIAMLWILTTAALLLAVGVTLFLSRLGIGLFRYLTEPRRVLTCSIPFHSPSVLGNRGADELAESLIAHMRGRGPADKRGEA